MQHVPEVIDIFRNILETLDHGRREHHERQQFRYGRFVDSDVFKRFADMSFLKATVSPYALDYIINAPPADLYYRTRSAINRIMRWDLSIPDNVISKYGDVDIEQEMLDLREDIDFDLERLKGLPQHVSARLKEDLKKRLDAEIPSDDELDEEQIDALKFEVRLKERQLKRTGEKVWELASVGSAQEAINEFAHELAHGKRARCAEDSENERDAQDESPSDD